MNEPIDQLNQLIRTRRSIFPPDYTDEEVPRAVIETIVANANFAPTHRLTQPWRFTLFRGDGRHTLADFLSETYRAQTPPESYKDTKYDGLRSKVLKSSCIIAINMDVHPDKVPEWEEVAAVSCAVQNMWLTATALNVGAYWSSPGNPDALNQFLNLGPDQKCLGLFFMGYHAAPEKPAIRKPIADKLTWVEK